MTMENSKEDTQIVSLEEIPNLARRMADTFLLKSDRLPRSRASISFYDDEDRYRRKAPMCITAGPICCEASRDTVRLHLCAEGLTSITAAALQGGIEQELMLWVLKQGQIARNLNFKRQIFPLMPVTGLAENHMQELVSWLQRGLNRYLASRELMDSGAGTPQVHFHFFTLGVTDDGPDHYHSLKEHAWIHALYLSRKLGEVMPIACLASGNVAFARELESRWWRAHDFLQTQARLLLQALLKIPERHREMPYDRLLVEMFTAVRDRYLISDKPASQGPPPTLH